MKIMFHSTLLNPIVTIYIKFSFFKCQDGLYNRKGINMANMTHLISGLNCQAQHFCHDFICTVLIWVYCPHCWWDTETDAVKSGSNCIVCFLIDWWAPRNEILHHFPNNKIWLLWISWTISVRFMIINGYFETFLAILSALWMEIHFIVLNIKIRPFCNSKYH